MQISFFFLVIKRIIFEGWNDKILYQVFIFTNALFLKVRWFVMWTKYDP